MNKKRVKSIFTVLLTLSFLIGSLPIHFGTAKAAEEPPKIVKMLPHRYMNYAYNSFIGLTDTGQYLRVGNTNITPTVEITPPIPNLPIVDYTYGIVKDSNNRVWIKGGVQGTDKYNYNPTAEWFLSDTLKDYKIANRNTYYLRIVKEDGSYWEAPAQTKNLTKYEIPDKSGVKDMKITDHQVWLLMNSGDVYFRGRGSSSGISGGSDSKVIDTFTKINGISNIVELSVSIYPGAALARDKDGKVYGWGSSMPYKTNWIEIQTPRELTEIPKAKQLAAGFEGSLVLTEDNEIYGYAANNTNYFKQTTNQEKNVFTRYDMLDYYLDGKPAEILMGGFAPFVRTERGSIYSWGNNNNKGIANPVKLTNVLFNSDEPSKPKAPANLKAETNAYSITASWDKMEGIQDYTMTVNGEVVYKSTEPNFLYTNVTPDTTYEVSVWANTSDGVKGEVSRLEVKTQKEMPSSPMNFNVSSTETSLTATWDKVDKATGYILIVNGKEIYRGPERTFTYTGLTPKNRYVVDLRSFNDNGESGEVRNTVTTKDPQKLPAPTNIKYESTSSSINLSWDAVEGANTYLVQKNNDFLYEGSETSFKIDGLEPEHPYSLYVYAINKSENGYVEGEPGRILGVTKKASGPANFVANSKANSVRLSWDAVDNTDQYKLMRGNMVIYVGPLTTYNDTDVEEGQVYNYSVIAINEMTTTLPSYTSGSTSISQLPYPANLRVTDLKYNKVHLEWDAVDGADEYEITRDGMTIGVPMGTFWIDDLEENMSGSILTYRVAAVKNGVNGKVTMKVVTIPSKPVQGEAPSGELVLKVNRVYHDRVGLSWNTVTGATYYDVYQDDTNKVWTGTLNTITDRNVGPEESHTYKVVAGNADGELASNVVSVTTPAAPQSIIITPSKPMEGTITFDFKVIDGAVTYVERNPQTTYTPVGDGTYHKTYYNAATGESRDEGIVTPVDGKLNFSESGVDPSKDYHYDIVAVMKKADGTEEVVAKEEVSVNTPADGSGATIPGTGADPDHGGTTPTPNPGTGTGGTPSPSNPSTPGNGSSPNNPSTGVSNPGSGSNTGPSGTDSKGSVTVPGTVSNSEGKEETNEDTPSISETTYSDIEGSFAKEAILSLTAKGIIKGYSDGTYGGKKKVTRAEFAIFLNRALGYVSDSPFEGAFKDLDGEAWYAPELNSALVHGITKGFNDGNYRPNAFIPREQAAIMLANVLLKKGLSVTTTVIPYADQENIVNWARESVNLVTQESVMSGYPGHKFLPKREMTREEAAQLIFNLIKS